MSATTAEAVSRPPAPGPSSMISRIASPCSITALNGALDRRERVVPADERGADADVDRAVHERGGADEPHHGVERARGFDVLRPDLVDPLVRDVVELDP